MFFFLKFKSRKENKCTDSKCFAVLIKHNPNLSRYLPGTRNSTRAISLNRSSVGQLSITFGERNYISWMLLLLSVVKMAPALLNILMTNNLSKAMATYQLPWIVKDCWHKIFVSATVTKVIMNNSLQLSHFHGCDKEAKTSLRQLRNRYVLCHTRDTCIKQHLQSEVRTSSPS